MDILDELKMLADHIDDENDGEPDALSLQLIGAIAEIRKLRSDLAASRAVLGRIAELDPAADSEEGFNEWGEADCFNQAQKLLQMG